MDEFEIYSKTLKGIKEAYSKSKSWEDIITSDYFNSDDTSSMEAFIDFVEDVYKTEVKDTKQLDKLTGLTTLLTKEPNIKKGKEPTLEDILTTARYSKYFRTLETALKRGAKYKDLLQIEPQDFGLPKTWSGCLGSDQYSSILWAISFDFMLNEPRYLMMLPDLRSIAQDIEAPYSVIMDCYKLFNKPTKPEVVFTPTMTNILSYLKTVYLQDYYKYLIEGTDVSNDTRDFAVLYAYKVIEAEVLNLNYSDPFGGSNKDKGYLKTKKEFTKIINNLRQYKKDLETGKLKKLLSGAHTKQEKEDRIFTKYLRF